MNKHATALAHAITKHARSRGLSVPARKPQLAIRQMACDMALIDALDTRTPRSISGVHRVLAWTASDLKQVPDSVRALLSQPLSSGYSLGVCFASSVSHPGGMYWIIMVAY